MGVYSVTLANGQKRYFARLIDPASGRKVSSKRFNRKRDAEKAETEMKARIYRGEPLERPKDMLFSEFADELMEQCTADSERTKSEYRGIQKWFADFFGKKTLREITLQDCERAVARLADVMAPNTVQKYVVRLRYVFRRAVAYGYIQKSPADEISNKPKAVNRRTTQFLETHEVKAMLAEADDYWRPLFTLWFATGMRRAEIFGLEHSCVDFENCRVHVRQQLQDGRIVPYTKNRRPRAIPVDPAVLSIVAQHMSTASCTVGSPRVVFPSKTGKPVHYSDFNRDVFKPLARSIGRPCMTTHDVRHTFASQALAQGVSIKALQEMLGHADASLTLNRYSHLIPSDARIAAEKMAGFLLHEDSLTRYGHSNVVALPVSMAV